MFSEQEYARDDKYSGFKKSQKIRRKNKGGEHSCAKCHKKKPQQLTKSHMAHSYSLPQTYSIELYALALKKSTAIIKSPSPP